MTSYLPSGGSVVRGLIIHRNYIALSGVDLFILSVCTKILQATCFVQECKSLFCLVLCYKQSYSPGKPNEWPSVGIRMCQGCVFHNIRGHCTANALCPHSSQLPSFVNWQHHKFSIKQGKVVKVCLPRFFWLSLYIGKAILLWACVMMNSRHLHNGGIHYDEACCKH